MTGLSVVSGVCLRLWAWLARVSGLFGSRVPELSADGCVLTQNNGKGRGLAGVVWCKFVSTLGGRTQTVKGVRASEVLDRW